MPSGVTSIVPVGSAQLSVSSISATTSAWSTQARIV